MVNPCLLVTILNVNCRKLVLLIKIINLIKLQAGAKIRSIRVQKNRNADLTNLADEKKILDTGYWKITLPNIQYPVSLFISP